MFDVSHMTIVDLTGAECAKFLSTLLANDIAKADVPGKAVYTCMLTDSGGIVDDLIAYHLSDEHYRLIVNAGTREKDLYWMSGYLPSHLALRERPDLAMVAIQGPLAKARLLEVLDKKQAAALEPLKRFTATSVDDWFIACTGYTGEAGYEIALPGDDAVALWQRLEAVGVKPCGLGARDTLRLEAGMNLYGSDMSEEVTPLECGIAWTVGWEPVEREFIGRAALEAQRNLGQHQVMKGLVLEGRGILRGHQKVFVGERCVGEVTSGTFSPTLQKSIAFARVDADVSGQCDVSIRDKKIPAQVVSIPFVKNGEPCFKPL